MYDFNSLVSKAKNLNFVSISDSKVLSPVDVTELDIRMNNLVRPYRMRNTDWRMFDLLQETPGIDRNTLNVLREVVVHHPEVTKRFYDVDRTFDNLKHFGDLSTEPFQWSKAYRMARTILRKYMFPVMRLNPLSLDENTEVDEIFSDSSTSAGAIASGSKADNWIKIRDTALHMLDMIDGDVPFQNIWVPAMPFHRSQLHGVSDGMHFLPDYEEKDRLIFGLDAASVCIEALFARPLIEYLKTTMFGYAGGKDPAQLRQNVHLIVARKDYWYSTDFSKFDQTVPDWLIHDIFNMFREMFDPKWKKRLDWIEWNFINTKLILPDKQVLEKHKGIPSGSYFTQAVGTLANIMMMLTYLCSRELRETEDTAQAEREVVFKLGTPLPFRHLRMMAMGDDNLFSYRDPIDLNDLSEYVNKVFGVVIHPHKTLSGKDSNPKFLSRWWGHVDGEDRDQIDLCINLVLPERVRTYKDYHPIDILVSLYYTFKYAFHIDSLVMHRFILRQMRKAGSDYTALGRLPKNELPGSAKVFSQEAREQLMDFVQNIV